MCGSVEKGSAVPQPGRGEGWERPVLQEGGVFSQNPSPGGSDMDVNKGKKMLVEAGPKGLGFIPKICTSLSGLGDIGCIPVLSKPLWPWGIWELFNGTRNSLEFWDQTSGCCWRGGSTALLGDRASWWPRQRWVHGWTGGTPRSFPTGIIPGLCGEIGIVWGNRCLSVFPSLLCPRARWKRRDDGSRR